jgi:hypothetical protein
VKIIRKLLGLGSTGSSKSEKPEKTDNPDKPWNKSDKGIAWAKQGKYGFPYNHTLSGEDFHMSSKMRKIEKKG